MLDINIIVLGRLSEGSMIFHVGGAGMVHANVLAKEVVGAVGLGMGFLLVVSQGGSCWGFLRYGSNG